MIKAKANNTHKTKPSDARILLADDDPRLLDSLSGLLKLYDYQVETALGGQQAVEKLSSNQYDLLLLDLKMPNVSGHDVMRYMSTNNINTMTIVVSGETSLDDISKALRHGAYDYLKKPYVPEELTATVNNAVRKKLLEDSNQQMQSRLNRSEKLHRFIVNNSPDIIFILDNEGNFSFINSKVETLLSYPRSKLIGKAFTTIVSDDDQEKAHYFFERAIAPHTSAQSIEICLNPFEAGHPPRHFEIAIRPIEDFNETGNFKGSLRFQVYGTARDVTERLEAEAFINFQAYHDLLTRLPNRALFKDRLAMSITQAQRNNTMLAVMFIDLDRFKVINDSLGHTMGDRLLQAVSQRLQTCIRKGDTLSRFGGDEFTLLLPDTRGEQAATQVAEKILESVKQPFALGEHSIYVGASIGIALYPESGDCLDSLIKNADIAMYRVKNTGKDGYQVYSHEMSTNTSERLTLENDLRRAMTNSEFEICYQPQVETDSRQICGVEALIRWNHPTLGRLSPASFIPVAEESRLIAEIDKLTLRRACREIHQYHNNGMPGLRLSVNLSPLLIERDDFVDTVLNTLSEENYPAELLELEITETLLMGDGNDIIDKLQRLSSAGVLLAIDDFGTGYSSLSYLQKFPINTLKIDRSFVNNIKSSEDESCIVNAIVAMAHGMKMTIIAEGVENKSQLAYLQALNCHIVQGFLFGKATALEHVARKFNSELDLLSEAEIFSS